MKPNLYLPLLHCQVPRGDGYSEYACSQVLVCKEKGIIPVTPLDILGVFQDEHVEVSYLGISPYSLFTERSLAQPNFRS